MDDEKRTELLRQYRARLRAFADEERARKAASFFPNRPPILGVPSGMARDLGRELAQSLRREGTLDDVIAIAGDLFKSGVLEEAALANEVLARFWRRFGAEHWPLFDRWIDCFTCWGTTDSFCVKVLGHLVLRDGAPQGRLRAWASSPHLWHRRAALACLIRALRKGREIALLYELADQLLSDEQDLVQKAIGWTFKELTKGDPQAVIAYVRTRRDRMTSLARRYACERLTAEQRRLALG